MKKLIAAVSAVAVTASLASFTAFAEEESVTVNVTVTDGNGNFGMALTPVKVTDIDGDGALTINDALFIAHENNFEGGAEAGYASSEGQYGLFLTKLWGTENGGSYGYYLNDKAASSLGDKVSDGDFISAYVYQDTTGFSDKYTFFDQKAAKAESYTEGITLTLYSVVFDENWTPVNVPAENLEITVSQYPVNSYSDINTKTGFRTDENGRVKVTFDTPGSYYLSAKSEDSTIVPPICRVNVAEGNGPAVTYWELNLPEPYVTSAESAPVTETSVSETTVSETSEPAAETTASASASSSSSVSVSAQASSPATGDRGVSGFVCTFFAVSGAALAVSKKKNEK